MDLEYNYTLANATGNVGAKTGQLAFIKDNKGTSGNRNRAYTYDKLGRLKQANGGLNGALWSQVYSYDQYGNRTGVAKTGNLAGGGAIDSDGIASLTINAATNRITTANFVYDEAGNQTQSNENGFIRNYRYDAAGRLYDVSDGSTTLATYSYGASNQRLQMVETGAPGATTLYAWDGGSVIAEYNGAGNGMAWTKSYIYWGGRLLATESALSVSTTETKYHHPERLGTRLVTSSTGAVVSENISLPFGANISGESLNLAGSTTKKRFTSYDRSDTTKLDYANNRHFSSAQGRFTQVDPIGMGATSLSNPQSLNLYAYCNNDPINFIDPSGLFALIVLAPEASATPVTAIIFWTAVAIIGALQLIFGGRAKEQTRMVGQSGQNFAAQDRGGNNSWIEKPLVIPGIGALMRFSFNSDKDDFKKDRISKGECLKILGAILDFVTELYTRHIEMRNDKELLQIEKVKGATGNGGKGRGTLGGHVQKIEEWAGKVRGELKKWDRGRCNGRGGPGSGKLVEYSRMMIDQPAPVPQNTWKPVYVKPPAAPAPPSISIPNIDPATAGKAAAGAAAAGAAGLTIWEILAGGLYIVF